MIFLPRSTLVPSSRTTSGTFRPTSFTAATTPSAITSHFMMPPKMLTRMPFTFGSEVMILNAAATFSLVALPPTSRKFAGAIAVELDDVHGRHREAGAVDHAADRAVERDVVEVVFRGLDFLLVFLGQVAQRDDIGMAKQRVAVEADLGVEADELVVLGDDQRIDLEQAHVLVDEGRVELGQQRLDLLLRDRR